MTITITNKRGFDVDDSERQARRRGIREKAAADEMRLAPIRLWEVDIESSRRRVDEATNEHSAACDPLQRELERSEQVAVERIGQRLPVDPEADARRGELLSLISNANKKLEEVIERENEVQASLRTKIRRLQTGIVQPYITLQRLAQPPAASPALLVQLFVAQQREKHATGRVAAAKIGLRIAESNCDTIRRGVTSGDLSVHLHKLNCWKAEAEAAAAEVTSAAAKSHEVYDQLLNE